MKHYMYFKERNKETGEGYIFMRISLNGRRIEFSTGHKVNCSDWNSGKQKVKGKDAATVNAALRTMINRAETRYQEALIKGENIELPRLKNAALGVEDATEFKSVTSLIESFLTYAEGLVGSDYTESTIVTYKVAFDHFKNFVKIRRKADFGVAWFTTSEIAVFHNYLISKENGAGLSINSAAKYHRKIQKAFNHFVKDDTCPLDKNPYRNFSIPTEETERQHLTEAELGLWSALKEIPKRLQLSYDLFLFACYTGLAFTDVISLKRSHLFEVDNMPVIKRKRKKSKVGFVVPLPTKCRDIIKSYELSTLDTDRLFPKIAGGTVNRQLKELAVLAGIDKKVHFHMARHSFACFQINNLVGLEAIGRALGQKKLSTTMIYAKMSDNTAVKAIKPLNL